MTKATNTLAFNPQPKLHTKLSTYFGLALKASRPTYSVVALFGKDDKILWEDKLPTREQETQLLVSCGV